MKKRLPPLNWLRAFEASARFLNFTHAAQELNLTQAAISQQLKALESQLGTALFKRLPRGLELTEAGMAYFPVVRESVERLAAATDEIFGQGHRSALIVRSSLVFFTHWLAMRLPRFRRLHPQINLRIASSIWVEDSDSDADLDIRYGQGRWSGLKSERLTWDTLVPVCSPALAAGESPLIQPQDLMRHELLHVLGYEDGWGYWLKKSGAEEIDSSRGLQFDTLISALEVAELGQGIALARSSLVRHLLDSGRLVAPFASDVTTKEAFYLVYAAHSMVNPDAAAFAEWLCAEATDFRNATWSGSPEDYQQ
ncbi:transcriptional regulator GcvA [Pseudomonas sp. 4810-S13]|uniref:transcriptional regulator GcvA n=1 Tax=Pseudomonas sp. 4810-S13 TaxID=3120822 RepID=UPI0031B6A083